MKKTSFVGMLMLLSVLLSACRISSTVQTMQQMKIIIHIESDAVYSVGMEYCMDRRLLGGQECMGNPSRTQPLSENEVISFEFTEMELASAENFGSGMFGFGLQIASADGEYVPLGVFWEWNAQYGEEYDFVLTGSRKSGFYLEPADASAAYTQTPMEEVVFK